MFKLGALALALGASSAMAETMSIKGQDVEVVRMPCDTSTPPGAKFDECLIGSTFIGCSDPSTVCMKKNFRFASCRPTSRGVPSNWSKARVILCDESSPVVVAAEEPEHEHVEVVVPKVTEAAEHEHVEVEVKEPAAKAVVQPAAVQTTVGHDHAKDHDPEEGTNCLHSDIFAPSGEQKCQCAGRLWRCADRADPIVKACDKGFKCIRKNKHYAICADPEGNRAKKIKATCEWDMTELPCGVHVGEYRTDKLLKRGVCPK